MLAPDLESGVVNQTGRSLDVAMIGEAMMAVQTADGAEAYTRRGDLRVGATGVLETGDGLPVIGHGGAITIPPAARNEIGAGGKLSIQPTGPQPPEMTEHGRQKGRAPCREKGCPRG